MSAVNIPPCPASLKPIQHFLKTAAEHDKRDIVVAYWCRLYALQLGLKTDRSSPDAKKVLGFLMDWLERTKADQKENEAIGHDIPAQAHLENYALKLFLWADSQDRAANFNKNVVKAFYTSGVIYDVLETFGELTDEVQRNRKYAKWKAAYIHNCLKNGETPVPGPMVDDSEDFDLPSSSTSQGITGFGGSQPSPAVGGNQPPYPPTSGFGGSQPSPAVGGNQPAYPTTPGFGMPSPVFPTPGGNGTSSNTPSAYPMDPPKPKADSPPKSDPVSPSKVSDFTNLDALTVKQSSTGVQLSPEQMTKAQKYCKWAASALNYDDVPTAVNNLQKALALLTTGIDD